MAVSTKLKTKMLKPKLKVKVIASSSGILEDIWCNIVLVLINTNSNFSKAC